jgi:hypothetical protein
MVGSMQSIENIAVNERYYFSLSGEMLISKKFVGKCSDRVRNGFF